LKENREKKKKGRINNNNWRKREIKVSGKLKKGKTPLGAVRKGLGGSRKGRKIKSRSTLGPREGKLGLLPNDSLPKKGKEKRPPMMRGGKKGKKKLKGPISITSGGRRRGSRIGVCEHHPGWVLHPPFYAPGGGGEKTSKPSKVLGLAVGSRGGGVKQGEQPSRRQDKEEPWGR